MRVVLEAGRSRREYLKDLWRYRELLYVLSWRDFSVRYKQTAVGIIWALLRPALTAVVFTVVFGKFGRFASQGVPYPVLVLVGMLPWQLFSAGLSESGTSLVTSSALITKVYFPRLIIPLSALFTSLVDFAISLIVVFAVMAFYRVAPSHGVILLPFFAALALLGAAGLGIWIAALNVKYRDFSYVVPFIAQMGLYISPVGYSSSIVPAKWQLLYHLNPMVAVIDGFRWCLLGGAFPITAAEAAISLFIIFSLLFSGVIYFRVTESTFADLI